MIFSGGEGSKANSQHHWVIWLTLLLGVTIDSLSGTVNWNLIFPDITPLILLYWVMAINQRNFIITSFIVGIAHDVLNHSGLGTYAIIYLLMIYPMLHLRLRLRNTTLLQMSLIMGLWMLAHQLLIWLMASTSRFSVDNIAFWSSAIVATLLWPLIFIMLRTLRRQMRVK